MVSAVGLADYNWNFGNGENYEGELMPLVSWDEPGI